MHYTRQHTHCRSLISISHEIKTVILCFALLYTRGLSATKTFQSNKKIDIIMQDEPLLDQQYCNFIPSYVHVPTPQPQSQ